MPEFSIRTVSAQPDPYAIVRETGAVHAEYLLTILASTPADRRDALIEGGRIRLGRFIVDNMPSGAPAESILAAAFEAFDNVISKGK